MPRLHGFWSSDRGHKKQPRADARPDLAQDDPWPPLSEPVRTTSFIYACLHVQGFGYLDGCKFLRRTAVT